MDPAQFLLRLGPALAMVIFGINQWRKPTDWLHYIPEWISSSSPMKPQMQMRLHAVGNIAFGLFLISNWQPYWSAWVALIWWVTILPFAFRASWAVGLRDLAITLGLLALVLLMR